MSSCDARSAGRTRRWCARSGRGSVIDRDLVDLWLDRGGPFRLPPFPDFLDRAVDVARRGDDRSLEPVRILPAEIRHVAMEGADHAGFERDIVDADQA